MHTNNIKPMILTRSYYYLFLVLSQFPSAHPFTKSPHLFQRVLPTWTSFSWKALHQQQQQDKLCDRVCLDMAPTVKSSLLQVGEEVGSGSYGTVHLCQWEEMAVICKRAWTRDELKLVCSDPKEREERCRYYFDVEKHCFERMESHGQIPKYYGTLSDPEGQKWMAFSILTKGATSSVPAPTLQNVIELDWKDQHQSSDQRHHLYMVQDALGLPQDATFADTLDVIFESLFRVLAFVHSQHIVHRDVKPANLLCDATTKSLVLIDFGSAADMQPVSVNFWGKKERVGLEDESRAAVSPIYSAPEVFINPDRAPYQFDVFSGALIFSQLLFNFLDERMDAGFHQQLEDSNWDLDSWLSRVLSSKVRPTGLEDALEYLGGHPGLWRLLGDAFRRDPEQRVSSSAALARFEQIRLGEATTSDGPFFESVVALMETCEIPPDIVSTGPRLLHFVATFRRRLPLGLVLAEAGQEFDGDETKALQWKDATLNAQMGEVFVQDIVPDGQADQMGIFEIGDRLQGIGELPLANAGFEKVVAMLEQQPQSAKYVKLHFDRKSTRDVASNAEAAIGNKHARVVEQGAWSTKGRRKTQEDTFVLHEIHSNEDILVAGVFDGHGGMAASHAASQLMPYLASEEIRREGKTARQALEDAWLTTCSTYRNSCDDESCVAEYDPREGTLQANTGSTDLVAGTTASVVAVQENKVTFLNCGDSRSLLVGKDGELVFVTLDHTPDVEIERLQRGQEEGYSMPKCTLSRWFLPVGDYEYAVSRSLEGPFATSKGIVSEPDVTTIPTTPGVLVIASDGLFEVMDNKEVARDVIKFRNNGMSAGDAAKELCSMAVGKGSSDNVSVIVLYLT